jgi:surfeit locus 1 family protein
MSRWSFRPPLWSVFGTAAGCALMLYLGQWQVHRGQAKSGLDLQYAAAARQAPVELNTVSTPPPGLTAQAVSLRGEYLGERQLLLDDQVHGDTPGYDVWTPLRLAGGGLVMINRGWIPPGIDRRHLPAVPAPAGPVRLRGLWRSLPAPGLRLASGCVPGQAPADWPRLVLYPTAADLACFYGEALLPGEVLLDPEAPDGYVREWRLATPGFPPARHYAYAAQWFAFSLTLLVLFIKLNLKRRPQNQP